MRRRFELIRHGVVSDFVAEGEEFCDGSVALHRVGGEPIEMLPSVEALLANYASDGRTVIRWNAPFTGDDGWPGA